MEGACRLQRAQRRSDLLVSALENEGVDRVFGGPGEENLDVVESLRSSRIGLVLTQPEQSAAFMAATHGRHSRRVGSSSPLHRPISLLMLQGTKSGSVLRDGDVLRITSRLAGTTERTNDATLDHNRRGDASCGRGAVANRSCPR